MCTARKLLDMPLDVADRFPKQTAAVHMVIEALEQELDPAYTLSVVDFLTPCIAALTRGEVLVGRRFGSGPVATMPLVVAYPDGRLVIDGTEVVCNLGSVELAPALRPQRRGSIWARRVQLPAPDAFELASIWYALIGWQGADMIARRGEGCPTCHGVCFTERDHPGIGRLAVPCDCVEVDMIDWTPEPDENVVAREEPGAWFCGADIAPAA